MTRKSGGHKLVGLVTFAHQSARTVCQPRSFSVEYGCSFNVILLTSFTVLQQDVMTGKPLDPTLKELKYNPKAVELYAPQVGLVICNDVLMSTMPI